MQQSPRGRRQPPEERRRWKKKKPQVASQHCTMRERKTQSQVLLLASSLDTIYISLSLSSSLPFSLSLSLSPTDQLNILSAGKRIYKAEGQGFFFVCFLN